MFSLCSTSECRVIQRASAMAYTFDSLGYAKRLRDRGVPQEQAEAHAEAARDFIMAELVTKTDLLHIKADLSAVKADLSGVKGDLSAVKADLSAVKADLQAAKQELQTELRTNLAEVRTSIANLDNKIETQSLRLTVRLGAMIVVGIGALATIMKLAQ